jgi:hypothetical protein
MRIGSRMRRTLPTRVYMTQMSSAAGEQERFVERRADARNRRLHRAARHAHDDQGDGRLDETFWWMPTPDVAPFGHRPRTYARRSTTT